MGLLKSDENLVELWGVVTYGEGMETSSISAEAGAATNAASELARELDAALAAEYSPVVIAVARAAYREAVEQIPSSEDGWHGSIWDFCRAIQNGGVVSESTE
jgi:hypothetical protein